MASDTGSKQLTLKLLVDKKKEVVLFAEAGKDVVDFIFHLLALPMGTVIRLLTKSTMVGSLGKLYESIETLNDAYMQSSYNKETLLKPKTPSYGGGSSEALLLPAANSSANSTATTYYRCCSGEPFSRCRDYVTLIAGQACPSCYCSMSRSLTLVGAPSAAAAWTVAPSPSGGGYVKGLLTYMVMDDLVVKPMSTISSITLLNKFNVMDLTALEEMIVDFGFEEGVKLLKASLESTNVLTNVFLGGKKKMTS